MLCDEMYPTPPSSQICEYILIGMQAGLRQRPIAANNPQTSASTSPKGQGITCGYCFKPTGTRRRGAATRKLGILMTRICRKGRKSFSNRRTRQPLEWRLTNVNSRILESSQLNEIEGLAQLELNLGRVSLSGVYTLQYGYQRQGIEHSGTRKSC